MTDIATLRDLVRRINARPHDAQLPAEYLLDEAADAITCLLDRLSHSTPGDAEVRKALPGWFYYAMKAAKESGKDLILEAKDIDALLATPSGRAQGEARSHD